MHQKDGNSSVNLKSSSERYAGVFVVIIAITLGAPIYENVKNALSPSLGSWPAFAIGILGAIAVTFPALAIASWISRTEKSGKTNDLSTMFYRPAVFPFWMFLIAASKNIGEFAEFLPWFFLAAILLLLFVAVLIQKSRGAAWSWWIAVPAGAGIGIVALLIAGFATWIIAPDQMNPS